MSEDIPIILSEFGVNQYRDDQVIDGMMKNTNRQMAFVST